MIEPLDNESQASDLTETGLQKLTEFNTFGWLIRYTEHRNTRIRALTWRLLSRVICRPLLENHASLIETSISAALEEMEFPVVKIAALDFIS